MKLKTIIIALSLLTALATAVGLLSFYASLKKAALTEDRLVSLWHLHDVENAFSLLIEHHDRMAETMAGQNALSAAIEHPDAARMSAANSVLDRFNANMETSVCYLMDHDGTTVASSNRKSVESFVGKNYAFRPYFKAAITGKPIVYGALGVTSDKRGLYFSHPVARAAGEPPMGVAVVKQDVDRLETRFLGAHYTGRSEARHLTVITDPNGIIFAADRKDLLFQSLWPLSGKNKQALAASKQFGKRRWGWSGFKKTGTDLAVGAEGTEYQFIADAIDAMPGWRIVHMSNRGRRVGKCPDIRLPGRGLCAGGGLHPYRAGNPFPQSPGGHGNRQT